MNNTRFTRSPSGTTDSGRVRLGAIAPALPQTKDSGKVRLGAIAPSLPRK